MKHFNDLSELGGRILMAILFVTAGYGKLGAGYAGTAGYMESAGVPGLLLPLVIALELGGGLLLAAGFQTRIVALLLAGFSLVSALLFHNNFADQMQSIMFMKNVSIAGGFLVVVGRGAGRLSVDELIQKRV